MNTHQTEQERQAAWDRVEEEMRAFETADLHAENASNAVMALAIIAIVVVAGWALGIF